MRPKLARMFRCAMADDPRCEHAISAQIAHYRSVGGIRVFGADNSTCHRDSYRVAMSVSTRCWSGDRPRSGFRRWRACRGGRRAGRMACRSMPRIPVLAQCPLTRVAEFRIVVDQDASAVDAVVGFGEGADGMDGVDGMDGWAGWVRSCCSSSSARLLRAWTRSRSR